MFWLVVKYFLEEIIEHLFLELGKWHNMLLNRYLME